MTRSQDQQTPEPSRDDGLACGLTRATQSIKSQYQADGLSQAHLKGEDSNFLKVEF